MDQQKFDKMYKEKEKKKEADAKKAAKETLKKKRMSLSHNPLKDEEGPLDKEGPLGKSILSKYGAHKKRR